MTKNYMAVNSQMQQGVEYSVELTSNHTQPLSKAALSIAANTKHSDEIVQQIKSYFDEQFSVTLYYGECSQHPNGVILVKLVTKGKIKRAVSYVLYDLETNSKFIDDVLTKFGPVASVDRDMLHYMVAYAKELKKRQDFEVVTSEEMEALLEEVGDDKRYKMLFQQTQQYIVDNVDILFGSAEEGNYDPNEHTGILLDSPFLVRKFGENMVGLNYQGLAISLGVTPTENRSNGYDKFVTRTVREWNRMRLMNVKNEEDRLQDQVIYSIDPETKKARRDRFYIMESKKAYAFLREQENDLLEMLEDNK